MDALATLNAELVTCRRCPRLVEWRERIAHEKRRAYRDWDYWGKPVPGFGDPTAPVMVVGLAPGAHGSNRTGRMFTGDASGDFLYSALYRAGFASQPNAISREDGLALRGLYITAVCRCAPPSNKPTPEEIRNCLPYLQAEIEILRPRGYVALGRIAFETLKSLLAAPAAWTFAHGALYRFPDSRNQSKDLSLAAERRSLNTDYWLLASYHPSRQNTQTGRLTVAMFDEIWRTVKNLLSEHETFGL